MPSSFIATSFIFKDLKTFENLDAVNSVVNSICNENLKDSGGNLNVSRFINPVSEIIESINQKFLIIKIGYKIISSSNTLQEDFDKFSLITHGIIVWAFQSRVPQTISCSYTYFGYCNDNSFVQEKLTEKLTTILGSPPKDVYWWYDPLGAVIEPDFIYKIFPKKKVTLSWKRT